MAVNGLALLKPQKEGLALSAQLSQQLAFPFHDKEKEESDVLIFEINKQTSKSNTI